MTSTDLDLLGYAQNSNSSKKPQLRIPVRCSEERKQALRNVEGVKLLSSDQKAELTHLFESYLSTCDEKCVILESIVNPNSEESANMQFLVLPYRVRFTDPEAQAAAYARYSSLWDAATASYKRAVHLILTTDPGRFPNLHAANTHFGKAYNRFMSYLKKRLGARPPYIASYEYTKSGLLHAHIILFGRAFLLPHRVITAEWERCEQGSYNWIYSLINNNGKWLYARQKPKDLKEGQTARDYLAKYLRKGSEQPEKLFLYWVFNKRFFTYSRVLATWEPVPELGDASWRFLMSCYSWDIPDIVLEESHFFADRGPP